MLHGCNWIKGGYRLWHVSQHRFWLVALEKDIHCGTCKRWVTPDGSYTEELHSTAMHFPDWRTIDALLFPQREFKVGDTVECLPDEEWFNCESRNGLTKQVGFVGKIIKIELATKHIAMAWHVDEGFKYVCLEASYIWPVRALRLVKAVE